MRFFQIPKTILPIVLAATKAYIQMSGKTEVAPQGCAHQGIAGRNSNGQLPKGGFGLPLFHPVLSGSAPSCLQNPRGLGREAPVLMTFYPQILRKSHLSFWREGKHEIDILVTGPRGPIMSFECKTSSETISDATHAVFRKRFPELPLFVASSKDVHPRKLENGVTVLPWHQALDAFLA